MSQGKSYVSPHSTSSNLSSPKILTPNSQVIATSSSKQLLSARGLRSSPDICVITDQPERGDDERGELYSDAAGKLIDGILSAMGYTRNEFCLTSICKARVSDSYPTEDHFEQYHQAFLEEIATINPRVIVALGSITLKGLFKDGCVITSATIGKWMRLNKTPLMPTFHPNRILCLGANASSAKKILWEHMKLVLSHLGRPIPVFQKKSRR